MAEDAGSLYIRLGLSLSDFETDLVAAERTVDGNIRRLSRQSELIRCCTQVEIAGFDETADAERILQIRTNALNRQMSLQRDCVSTKLHLRQKVRADYITLQKFFQSLKDI